MNAPESAYGNAPESEAEISGLVAYLHARGQLTPALVTRLAGGVSAETVLVEQPPARLVVKTALRRLRVAADWTAKPERAATEADALKLLHGFTPDHTPQLRDFDAALNTIVMTAAPADWVPWKSVLFGEIPDPALGSEPTAAILGTVLGTWHARTWHDPAVAARFADYEAFEQLRVTPFHRAVAAAHPAAAARIGELAEELLTRRDCLVHGDYSPKNVLVGPDGLMVLDFEVAHFGAAVFDVAFLQCHLALKALRAPARAAEFALAATAFVTAYEQTRADPDDTALERLSHHTACLLLARVDGMSPAGYLSPATCEVVRRLALDLLRGADLSVTEFWNRVLGATA